MEIGLNDSQKFLLFQQIYSSIKKYFLQGIVAKIIVFLQIVELHHFFYLPFIALRPFNVFELFLRYKQISGMQIIDV